MSLSHYFGPYSFDHAMTLLETVAHMRDLYLTHDNTVTLACHEGLHRSDLIRPRLLAAKLASPCTWNAALAHSAYVGLPFLHPDYDFPTFEICDEFFTKPDWSSPTNQGMIISHEFFHWLENDYGLLKDHFKPDVCDTHDPKNECMFEDEINGLANADQELAGRNIHGYAMFAQTYANLYYDETCEEAEAYCFEIPWCPEDGADGGPPPIPPECEGEEGTCIGGACAPVESLPSLSEKLNPFSPAHPDGNFAKDMYCEGADVVCLNKGGEGRCVECGPENMLGCPCTMDDECENDGLVCWGGDMSGWPGSQGFCWDPVEGPPPFQCSEGCYGRSDYLGNADYYCYHDTDVVEEAVCVHTDCNVPDAFCVADDLNEVCDGSSCEPECTSNAHCDPNYGWPNGAVCQNGSCTVL